MTYEPTLTYQQLPFQQFALLVTAARSAAVVRLKECRRIVDLAGGRRKEGIEPADGTQDALKV